MKKNTVAKFTKKDFEKMFPDEKACFDWLVNHRYPNGIDCPVCKKPTKHHKLSKRPVYECDYCGHQVSPLAGTIFHKSSTPLKVWFDAIYEMSTTRTGYSAKALQRRTGVTYKTAWRMFNHIRKLLDESTDKLNGVVEIDETYIGGKKTGVGGGYIDNKTPVIGAVEREGEVKAKVVENTKWSTVAPFTVGNIDRRTVVFTDENKVYNSLRDMGYIHRTINHSANQYKLGVIHTNSIEGFWSLVKRGISGVYHCVSPKYLQSYINEYSFSYNHRYDEIPMFLNVLYQIRQASQ